MWRHWYHCTVHCLSQHNPQGSESLGTRRNQSRIGGSIPRSRTSRHHIVNREVRANQVTSGIRHNLGFVASSKRFNVSLTRDEALLIVVGCSDVSSLDKENWMPFLKYCRRQGVWKGQEWDLNLDISSTLDTDPGEKACAVLCRFERAKQEIRVCS